MKEDHGLVCGITTTLVDGATMFFFGAWDYHVFFFLCVWMPRLFLVCGITTTLVWCVGLPQLDFCWCVELPRLLFDAWDYHGFMRVSLPRPYVRMTFICVCPGLYVRRFITALCVLVCTQLNICGHATFCARLSLYVGSRLYVRGFVPNCIYVGSWLCTYEFILI